MESISRIFHGITNSLIDFNVKEKQANSSETADLTKKVKENYSDASQAYKNKGSLAKKTSFSPILSLLGPIADINYPGSSELIKMIAMQILPHFSQGISSEYDADNTTASSSAQLNQRKLENLSEKSQSNTSLMHKIQELFQEILRGEKQAAGN